MKTTTLSGTTTTYSYTGDGRRAQATTGAGAANTTNYMWDIANSPPQLALERDGANALVRRYTYGLNRLAMSTPTASFYYHTDDRGSPSNLTTSTGTKRWTYVYEPYGTLKTETASGSAPTNVMKFTGEQLDPTGLYHLRARQYDPIAGSFATRDPVENGGLSAFAYVQNRPTVWSDPLGLKGGPGAACSMAARNHRDDPTWKCPYIPKGGPFSIQLTLTGVPIYGGTFILEIGSGGVRLGIGGRVGWEGGATLTFSGSPVHDASCYDQAGAGYGEFVVGGVSIEHDRYGDEDTTISSGISLGVGGRAGASGGITCYSDPLSHHSAGSQSSSNTPLEK